MGEHGNLLHPNPAPNSIIAATITYWNPFFNMYFDKDIID